MLRTLYTNIMLENLIAKDDFPFIRTEKTINKSNGTLLHELLGVPVLPIDSETQMIAFPPSVERVWIDVGAHKDAMYTFPHLKKNEDLGVIAFEPMYDKWGELFFNKHSPRLFPIPAAVSLENGLITFRRAATDMCSSIKGIEKGAEKIKWPGGCRDTAFEFTVATLRLDTILEKIPFDTIEFLKVDAQGADFEVVESAGKHLRRIKSFVVEVQIEPLYADAKTEADYKEYFENRGFELVHKKLQNAREENLLFRNLKYPLPEGIPLDEFFSEDKKI